MNTDERQLIEALFERMRALGMVEKHADADALIGAETQRTPDALYLLVQSVLVQEQALAKADARIRDLELRLAESARPAASTGIGAPRSSAGFGGGSVPVAGGTAPRSGPAASERGFAEEARAATHSASRGDRHGDRQANAQRTQGGGFMAQALSTAAGVAGGMLLASGISSLFAGDAAASGASAAETAATDAGAAEQQASLTDEITPQDEMLQDAQLDEEAFGGDEWADFGDGFDI